MSFQDLSDIELAAAIEVAVAELEDSGAGGQPAQPETTARLEKAREEAMRRFDSICLWQARKYCGPVAHRGGSCGGSLDDSQTDHPFSSLRHHYLLLVGGRSERGRLKPVRSLLVNWTDQSSADPFPDHFLKVTSASGRTDALRVWNADRDLNQKMRYRQGERELLEENYLAAIANDSLESHAISTGLGNSEAVDYLANSLWWDACQVAYADLIDHARISRQLWSDLGNAGSPSQIFEDETRPLIDAFDAMAALVCPKWYDDYLGKPRQHTRQHAPLPERQSTPTAESNDNEDLP